METYNTSTSSSRKPKFIDESLKQTERQSEKPPERKRVCTKCITCAECCVHTAHIYMYDLKSNAKYNECALHWQGS